jgi:hypothetical protein
MVIGSRRWHIQSNEKESGVHLQECHVRDASGAVDPLQQCLNPYDEVTCDPERQTREPRSTNITLLLVCRQFYEEAAKLKWQNHVFQVICLHRADIFRRFIKQLSNWQFKAINTLHVHYAANPLFDHCRVSFHMISEMDGLQHLLINPLMTSRTPQSREAMWKLVKHQFMALRPLNMSLAAVLILACPLPRASVPLASFVDLTEFWRELMAETQDRYGSMDSSHLSGETDALVYVSDEDISAV